MFVFDLPIQQSLVVWLCMYSIGDVSVRVIMYGPMSHLKSSPLNVRVLLAITLPALYTVDQEIVFFLSHKLWHSEQIGCSLDCRYKRTKMLKSNKCARDASIAIYPLALIYIIIAVGHLSVLPWPVSNIKTINPDGVW